MTGPKRGKYGQGFRISSRATRGCRRYSSAGLEQGEYDEKDPAWIPLPQKYLANQSWMRPVRQRKKPNSIDQKDAELRARYERGVQRIRERENNRWKTFHGTGFASRG